MCHHLLKLGRQFIVSLSSSATPMKYEMSFVIFSCRRRRIGIANELKIRCLWIRVPPPVPFFFFDISVVCFHVEPTPELLNRKRYL